MPRFPVLALPVIMLLVVPATFAQATTGSSTTTPYTPLTLSGRYKWAVGNSVSPAQAAGSAVASAWFTMTNSPKEYGPHWDGFGKRFGIRIATGATGSFMEASIGALWNEDPRYVRAAGQPFKKRLGQVVKMTFASRNRNGEYMPAYARFISVPSNSYLSNAWRADSEATAKDAALRIPFVFVTRAAGNAFTEFWPDITKLLHRDRK